MCYQGMARFRNANLSYNTCIYKLVFLSFPGSVRLERTERIVGEVLSSEMDPAEIRFIHSIGSH